MSLEEFRDVVEQLVRWNLPLWVWNQLEFL